jgi:hypothetical protein
MWYGRNKEICVQLTRKEQENSVVQVAGMEQREMCSGGWEGTEITVYRWLGRNRENFVQVAGKEQGKWYRWLGRNRENCAKVRG